MIEPVALRGSLLAVVAAALLATPAVAQQGASPGNVPVVLVAVRDLPRGEVLTLEDVTTAPLDSASAREVGEVSGASAAETLVGWTTRRVISAGEPLRPPAVSPPDLVKAGDAVKAIWRGKSVELTVTGTAAGSAALGERVLVRVDARRRLEGVVIGPGVIQLESTDRGR